MNSILERKEENIIVDVVFNDPHNIPDPIKAKYSIVDILCTDQQGSNYIVEMQVIKQKDYAERAQYYSALALSRQLQQKEEYTKLTPVIFVAIICFDLFKSTHYISHHLILDTVTGEHKLKHLEFHFIELNKFNKELSAVYTVSDKWIYLLKNAARMKTVPTAFKEAAVKEAFEILEQGNWSAAELDAYDRYHDAMRSQVSQLETAWADGKEQGLERGKALGELHSKQKIALQMLGKFDMQIIPEITGLSIEEILKLKNN